MIEQQDVFEPVYSPKRIEFWLAHYDELLELVFSGKTSAHIAEHLNREWFLLQSRLRHCLCKELHAVDSLAVDPGCTHSPSGGSYRQGPETALCIMADLSRAAESLPATWLATQKIWDEQRLDRQRRDALRARTRILEREPIWARSVAIRRMALELGWRQAA